MYSFYLRLAVGLLGSIIWKTKKWWVAKEKMMCGEREGGWGCNRFFQRKLF